MSTKNIIIIGAAAFALYWFFLRRGGAMGMNRQDAYNQYTPGRPVGELSPGIYAPSMGTGHQFDGINGSWYD